MVLFPVRFVEQQDALHWYVHVLSSTSLFIDHLNIALPQEYKVFN